MWLRMICFYTCLVPLTIFFALLSFLAYPLKFPQRYWLITRWSHAFIYLSRQILGLDYRVHGIDHLPKEACVVLCKHQSAWETIFCQVLLPPQHIILKQELLWIPFFGWGLRFLEPIAINRRQKRSAQQVLEQGLERLEKNRWVLIFPEGTRVPYGQTGHYARTGAQLAIMAQVPVIPLAHNAGKFWPKGFSIKQSGTIDVVIGPPLSPEKHTSQSLTQAAQSWIEQAVTKLP